MTPWDSMSKTNSCHDCKRPFRFHRWRRRCKSCERTLCASCLVQVRLPNWVFPALPEKMCLTCHETKAAPLEKRYQAALSERVKVFAYVGSYRGEPAVDPDSRLPIESGYHRTQEEAVRELQTIAAFHNRKIVEELGFREMKNREVAPSPGEGPLPFAEQGSSMWKAVGVGSSFLEPRRS